MNAALDRSNLLDVGATGASRKWLNAAISKLTTAGVTDAAQKYQKLYADDAARIHESYRDRRGVRRYVVPGAAAEWTANRWIRAIYDEVAPLFSGTFAAQSVADLADSLSEKFAGRVKLVQMGGADLDATETAAAAFLAHLNLAYPSGQTRESKLRRLACAKWWRRRLNRAISRIVDQTGRTLGMVRKGRECYISDTALAMFRSRQRAGAELLAEMIATNQDGQTYTVADLASRSVSNPVARRTETMVRLRGTETVAQYQNHGARFITLTCPSRYHAATKNRQNRKFDGSSPVDANRWLNQVWARVRADMHRRGTALYGMWSAEPHHDGTPHRHILVWGKETDLMAIEESVYHHALADEGTERGAWKHRVTVERIEHSSKRSAVGYMAKYVAKNIDGAHLDDDLYGNSADEAAERITAWARTWGMRQFQFFGCAPVGPWREFRRIRDAAPHPYAEAVAAADRADWATYTTECALEHFTIWREPDVDHDTGECDPPYNNYGEPVPARVRGVITDDDTYGPLITRLHTWTITRERRAGLSAPRAPWTCVNNCTPHPETHHQPGAPPG